MAESSGLPKLNLQGAFGLAEPSKPQGVSKGDVIRSNGFGNVAMEQKFKQLTGSDQAALKEKWKKDSTFTTCGDLVIHYCNHLGIPAIRLLEGQPKQFCQSQGKGIAWISNSDRVSLKGGDVFYETGNHVGVSMEYDGSIWRTAEGGQGGKALGYDMVMRKTRLAT